MNCKYMYVKQKLFSRLTWRRNVVEMMDFVDTGDYNNFDLAV